MAEIIIAILVVLLVISLIKCFVWYSAFIGVLYYLKSEHDIELTAGKVNELSIFVSCNLIKRFLHIK